MDLDTLIQTTRDLLEEPTDDRFTDAEITRWLNRGLEDIAAKTGYLLSSTTQNTTPSQRVYNNPSGCLWIDRIEYNDEVLPKNTKERLDIHAQNSNWLAQSGAPKVWYVENESQFGIYKIPDSSYSLTIYYFSLDTTLSVGTDTPNLPSQHHLAICYFAAWKIKQAEGELDAMNSFKADYYDCLRVMQEEKRKRESGRRNLIKLADWSS